MPDSTKTQSIEKQRLVVYHLDDEPLQTARMQQLLEEARCAYEYTVHSANSIEAFWRLESTASPDLIILDVHVGNHIQDGSELCPLVRQKFPHSVILMHSAFGSSEIVSKCLHSGADNFIDKGLADHELASYVTSTYQLAHMKRGTLSPCATTKTLAVGETIQAISSQLPAIINSAVSAILIHGESGTGKEVVCDLLAAQLPARTPMVRMNCGALTPSLLEGELFGSIRGAYTGATSDRQGLIEKANGGWIYFDEVTSLSLSAQAALLRVLENQEIRRVGDNETRKVRIRVIAATNEDISDMVSRGLFRGDLWQRLREAEFTLPPLRARRQEIPALINHLCATMAKGPFSISQPAMEILCNADWKDGNVRELRNCLRSMTALHHQRMLTPIAIPHWVMANQEMRPLRDTEENTSSSPDFQRSGYERLPALAVTSTVTQDAMVVLKTPAHPSKRPNTYAHYADLLLVALTRKAAGVDHRLSLRALARQLGMSRTTLSHRLRGAIANGLMDAREFQAMTGIDT